MVLGRRFNLARPQSFFVLIGACSIALMVLGGCGTDDTPASGESCRFDEDCSFGTVCSNEGSCVEAACEFCVSPDQVCTTPDNPGEGSCTKRECSFDDECEGEQVCYEGLCVDEAPDGGSCESDADCADGQMCNLAGECVEDTGGDMCADSTECADGEFCNLDSGECAAGECYDSTECAEGETCNASNICEGGSTDCTPGSCGAGETCNTETGQCEQDPAGCDPACADGQHCEGTTCVDDCTAGSCPDGETCNAATGECETDTNCPPGSPDPGSCTGGQVFSDTLCACVECTDESMCTGDERCNSNGQCVPPCATSCTSQTAQQDCGSGTPYCISGCCVECIGNADCGSGQACLDGFCGQAPDCTQDPSICQSGYSCNQSTGQCEPDQSGDCTQTQSCPTGTICNPQTGQCESAGGAGGGTCGFCDANCGCPDGLTCQQTALGQACVGCTPFIGSECSSLGSEMSCSIFGALINGEGACLPFPI